MATHNSSCPYLKGCYSPCFSDVNIARAISASSPSMICNYSRTRRWKLKLDLIEGRTQLTACLRRVSSLSLSSASVRNGVSFPVVPIRRTFFLRSMQHYKKRKTGKKKKKVERSEFNNVFEKSEPKTVAIHIQTVQKNFPPKGQSSQEQEIPQVIVHKLVRNKMLGVFNL